MGDFEVMTNSVGHVIIFTKHGLREADKESPAVDNLKKLAAKEVPAMDSLKKHAEAAKEGPAVDSIKKRAVAAEEDLVGDHAEKLAETDSAVEKILGYQDASNNKSQELDVDAIKSQQTSLTSIEVHVDEDEQKSTKCECCIWKLLTNMFRTSRKLQIRTKLADPQVKWEKLPSCESIPEPKPEVVYTANDGQLPGPSRGRVEI